MADLPYLPFFVSDYRSDTQHLSWEEHGLYINVLMEMWIAPECRIPNDDKWLARRFRLGHGEVTDLLRPLLNEFCQTTGNWITQGRLRAEWEHALKKSKNNSGAAKSRWGKQKNSKNAYADAMRSQCEPKPKPKPKEESLPLTGEGSSPALFGVNANAFEAELPSGPPAKPKRSGPTICPDDFEPTAEHHALADELSLSPRDVTAAVCEMRDWSRSGGKKKLDWNATFRNWLRSNARRKPGAPRGGGNRGGLTFADIARGDY